MMNVDKELAISKSSTPVKLYLTNANLKFSQIAINMQDKKHTEKLLSFSYHR